MGFNYPKKKRRGVIRTARMIDGKRVIFCAAGHEYIKYNAAGRCRTCAMETESKYTGKSYRFGGTITPRSTACDLCNESGMELVRDHNWKTKMFRGWLCRRCNASIGSILDRLPLERLVAYLNRGLAPGTRLQHGPEEVAVVTHACVVDEALRSQETLLAELNLHYEEKGNVSHR